MTPPAPTDADAVAFLDNLARSRLLPVAKLTAWRAVAEKEGTTAEDLAERLTHGGELTAFQAHKLLRGQWSGLVLGPFVILNPIGRGGMGVVYLARNVTLTGQPLVALKVLPPTLATEAPRTAARFEREMALGLLVPDHPNIARMLSSGIASGINYIAMEFVPGKTLKTTVAKTGPMPIPAAARAIADTARGLQAAHSAGLIHRDLKPSNVIITPNGSAKLLDFGLAVRMGEDLPNDPRIVGGAGYAVGTMDYIAPEQAEHAMAVTPASDLYALGGTLYFALAGCPPFPGGTATQKIKWHRTESPPPLRSLNPDVDPELAVIVTRLMAKDPADRPASASDVARELEKWAAESNEPDGPVTVVALPTNPNIDLDDEEWSEVLPAATVAPPPPRVPPGRPMEKSEMLFWVGVMVGIIVLAVAAGFLAKLLVG